MIKKLKVLAVCILLVCSMMANALTIGSNDIKSVPDGWTVSETPNAESEAKIDESGGVRLYVDTTADTSQKGESKIETSAYNLSGDVIVISMDAQTSSMNKSEKAEQTMTVQSDVQSSTKLISIKNGTIEMLGGKASATWTESVSHKITLAIDTSGESVKASAWFDGELKFSGVYDGWKTSLDTSSMKILLKNTVSKNTSEKSEWKIDNFAAKVQSGIYEYTTIPLNGQNMVSPDSTNAISLAFGTRVGDVAYSKSNYTLSCGAEDTAVDFEVEASENGVKIIPSGGFDYSTSYKLAIKEISDIFGNKKLENTTVSFDTAPEGYVAPTIGKEFDPDTLNVYKGQRVPLTFTSNAELDKMEVYVNDQKRVTLTAEPYTYNLQELAAGIVKVKAAGYDKQGGCTYSDEYSITIKDHNAPTLSVTGISYGLSYNVDALPTITATASDDNGVADITMKSDGELVKSVSGSTASFSLEGLSGGSHVIEITATDIYGFGTSESYLIKLESMKTAVSYKNDFSDYTGGNALPRDMAGGKQRGYIDAVTLDAEHGKSLALGIDVANASATDPAYVGIPVGGATGMIRCEMDILADNRPASGDTFRMSLKKTGSTEADFLIITPDEMQLMSTGGATWNNTNVVGERASYDIKEWYHLTLEINVAESTFTLSVGDATQTGTLPATLDALDQIRVFGPKDDAVKTYIAVDNVVVSRYLDLPELSFADPVDYKSTSVTFTTSEELNALDITKENFKLEDEFSEVAIKSVSASGSSITIVPEESLRSNMNYKVTISPEVRYSAGPTIGLAAEGSFTTSKANFEITEGSFGGGKFNFEALNQTSTDRSVVVIIQVWDGTAVSKVYAENVTIGAGTSETMYEVGVPTMQSGEVATAYIWDKLIGAKPVSPRSFASR